MTDTPGSLSISTEIIIILALVIVNGVLSMTEMALVSSKKSRLQHLADNGDMGAKKALDALSDPNRFFSSIQIGITLIGILAGVFGGATVAKNLGEWLKGIAFIGRHGHTIGIGVVVVGITYLSLVIGELVPKRLALNHPEKISSLMAAPMNFLARIAAPFVFLLGLSTDTMLMILRVRPKEEHSHTEDEIKILIEESTQAGVFEKDEQDFATRALCFGDIGINDIMTPRPDIVSLNIDDRPEEIREKVTASGHSQFPVYRQDPDNILGMISIKDLLARFTAGQDQDLQAVLFPPLFVYESLGALKVLELFKQSGKHVALIIDEYGTVQGIVTLHDIFEALVGDIPTLESAEDPIAFRREDGSWLIDGLLPLDKFKELFEIGAMPQEETGHYRTIAGFMLLNFKQIPTTGSSFEWSGLRFEVVDMDGCRIDKVLVEPVWDKDNGTAETEG